MTSFEGPYSTSRFAYTQIRKQSRVLIHAECRRCGATLDGSAYDGSLQRWENSHKCSKRQTEYVPRTTDTDAVVTVGSLPT